MPFHHKFPNPSLTVHHPLPRWEWRLTSPLSRAVPHPPALPCPQGPRSRAITPTGTPPWAAGPTPTSPRPSCSRATPLPRHPLCHPCRCTRHPRGPLTQVCGSFRLPQQNSHFPLWTVCFIFWRFFFSAKKTSRKSWTIYNSRVVSLEIAWNCCFRKTSWSLKWACPEAVAVGASGHQKQSQVVKFCCSFLWVSEFAEVQPCCCIFCASAVNQVIQLFAGYGKNVFWSWFCWWSQKFWN